MFDLKFLIDLGNTPYILFKVINFSINLEQILFFCSRFINVIFLIDIYHWTNRYKWNNI